MKAATKSKQVTGSRDFARFVMKYAEIFQRQFVYISSVSSALRTSFYICFLDFGMRNLL